MFPRPAAPLLAPFLGHIIVAHGLSFMKKSSPSFCFLSKNVAIVRSGPLHPTGGALWSSSLSAQQPFSLSQATHDSDWHSFVLPHASVAQQSRSDFVILNRTLTETQMPLIYLDSAATSQKPHQVIKKLNDYYQRLNSNVHRGAHTLSREATSEYEASRDKVARFINATSRNEIVFASGATDAINLVAQTYGRAVLSTGDEIVLTAAEHHSNLVPWQMLAKEKGLVIKFVRFNVQTGELNWSSLESLLTEKTKLVSFQHVSNVLGCVHPVKEVVSVIRRISPSAVILLDACQSVPHMAVDVQDLGVDFLAASGHKMCGPTGIGFLWGQEHLLNMMPPWKGGGEMIDQVSLDHVTFLDSPSRFEAGTPAIAQAIGLGAAVDYLQAIGMDKIEAYEHELAQYLFHRLIQVPGVSVLGSQDSRRRVGLCAFVHESVHPSDLSTFLDMEGIAIRAGHHCCQPLHQELGLTHSARASLYFYNTKEEIDVFIDKLIATLQFFQSMELPEDKGGFVPFV